MGKGAVVLLSGGQDSATVLAMVAAQSDQQIHTVSFDYGQRHRIELRCSIRLSQMAKAVHHHQIPINSFSFVTQSALLHDNKQNWPIDAPHPNNVNLPASFVPGRNLIFLTLAAALAYKFEIRDLYTGVCETDYSGYPDCRLNTIDALQLAISRGMDVPFTIHTPLMFDTKAETVLRMKDLGRLDWYKETHTCYEGVRPGCRVCPSCILRQKGFDEAGIKDPLFE